MQNEMVWFSKIWIILELNTSCGKAGFVTGYNNIGTNEVCSLLIRKSIFQSLPPSKHRNRTIKINRPELIGKSFV